MALGNWELQVKGFSPCRDQLVFQYNSPIADPSKSPSDAPLVNPSDNPDEKRDKLRLRFWRSILPMRVTTLQRTWMKNSIRKASVNPDDDPRERLSENLIENCSYVWMKTCSKGPQLLLLVCRESPLTIWLADLVGPSWKIKLNVFGLFQYIGWLCVAQILILPGWLVVSAILTWSELIHGQRKKTQSKTSCSRLIGVPDVNV